MTAAVGNTLTPDELDALPAGAVIALTGRRHGPPTILQRSPGRGWANTVQDPYSMADVVAFATDPAEGGPATVVLLMLPDQPPRPERVIKADALRKAAAAWQVNGWADDMPKGSSRPALILGMAQRACDFLRARADRVEAGESS